MVRLCGLCLVFYESFLWLWVRRIWFIFRCLLPCDATFLFWPFHRISVSLPTINMHIAGFFRFLGSRRSVWINTSWASLLRIPCFLQYRLVCYLCYVWVLFVDLIYALSYRFWICLFLCLFMRFMFGVLFLISFVVCEKRLIYF